jgi:hypothetical protein
VRQCVPSEPGVRVFCFAGSAYNQHHERDDGEQIPQRYTTALVFPRHSIKPKFSILERLAAAYDACQHSRNEPHQKPEPAPQRQMDSQNYKCPFGPASLEPSGTISSGPAS